MGNLTSEQLIAEIRKELDKRQANLEFYLDMPDTQPSALTPGSLRGHGLDYLYVGQSNEWAPNGIRLFDDADQGHELEAQSPFVLAKILKRIVETTNQQGHTAF